MPAELHLSLPRHDSAAGIARQAIHAQLAGELGRERTGDLALVVSELVTNAVAHGRGAISLRLQVEGDRVHGEVVDDGGGFEQEVRDRGPDDFDGRGLQIVDALSTRWGIHEGTTHVWFELARPEAPTKLTDPKLGDDARPAALDKPPAAA